MKPKKILIKSLKIFGLVCLFLTVVLVLSIPSSKLYESDMRLGGSKIDKIVLTNGNIVTMNDSIVLENHDLYVQNNKITSIRPDSLPSLFGYKVIDLKGKYILPGLIDMHAHIFDRSDLPAYLSYGVTSVRNMMGFPMHLRWKKQLAENSIYGSNLFTATPTINSGSNSGPFHKKLGNENVVELLKEYVDEGYDFVKIYNGITSKQFESIIKASGKIGVKVAGHPPSVVKREVLLSSSLSSFEHIEEVFNTYMKRKINDSLANSIAKDFRINGKPLCATLSAFNNITRAVNEKDVFIKSIPKENISPMLWFIGSKQLSGYMASSEKAVIAINKKNQYLSQLTKLFYDNQIPMILGTDTGPNLTIPGVTLHDEIELLSNAGISNYDILKSGTINAALVLGISDESGTITVNKNASIIILEGNPLTDLSVLKNPKNIILRGIYYDKNAIKKLREIGNQKTGWYITLGNFLEHLIKK